MMYVKSPTKIFPNLLSVKKTWQWWAMIVLETITMLDPKTVHESGEITLVQRCFKLLFLIMKCFFVFVFMVLYLQFHFFQIWEEKRKIDTDYQKFNYTIYLRLTVAAEP